MILLESLLALGASGDTASLLPPRDAHIHISDTLDASGAFVLTHYVLTALQQPAHSVVWVSCHADGFAHWNSIARKAVRRRAHTGYASLATYCIGSAAVH